MPLPTQAPLTASDREFLLGRALLVILGLNAIWALAFVVTVWALR
jgi:hypothetical protein